MQGHVDGVGHVVAAQARGPAWDVRIAMPAPLLRYVIEKGSITLDGISLTINRVDNRRVDVSIIPHTQLHTNLPKREVGDPINIEVDMIAKYVERLLGSRLS